MICLKITTDLEGSQEHKYKHGLASNYNRDQHAITAISWDQIRESKYGGRF